MEINKIYNGDCLEVLKTFPSESVDMVLTDFFYGMSFRSNYRKEKYKKIENDSKLDWLPELVGGGKTSFER
jgi:DNA modification methylase